MRETIKEEQIGTRNVAGTDWPVVRKVDREQLPGRKPTWIALTVCNGIGSDASEHATQKAALAAF